MTLKYDLKERVDACYHSLQNTLSSLDSEGYSNVRGTSAEYVGRFMRQVQVKKRGDRLKVRIGRYPGYFRAGEGIRWPRPGDKKDFLGELLGNNASMTFDIFGGNKRYVKVGLSPYENIPWTNRYYLEDLSDKIKNEACLVGILQDIEKKIPAYVKKIIEKS